MQLEVGQGASTLADAIADWNAQPAGTSGVITIADSQTYTIANEIVVPAEQSIAPRGRRTAASAPDRQRDRARQRASRRDRARRGVFERTVDRRQRVRERWQPRGSADQPHDDRANGGLAPCRRQRSTGSQRRAIDRRSDSRWRRRCAACGSSTALPTPGPATWRLSGRQPASTAAPSWAQRSSTVSTPATAFSLGQVSVQRRQTGCVRFSFVPPGSLVPRRFRCQPADGVATAGVTPRFTSLNYGQAGYAPARGDVSARNQRRSRRRRGNGRFSVFASRPSESGVCKPALTNICASVSKPACSW